MIPVTADNHYEVRLEMSWVPSEAGGDTLRLDHLTSPGRSRCWAALSS